MLFAVLGSQLGFGEREREREEAGGEREAGYKMANFIARVWIKLPPLKTLRNAHVPIRPRWHGRELRGRVFGGSCSGLPDCLGGAAFVPSLIRCQPGPGRLLANPDASPSICWHQCGSGIKNDPIRGWQYVMTGKYLLGRPCLGKRTFCITVSVPICLFCPELRIASTGV